MDMDSILLAAARLTPTLPPVSSLAPLERSQVKVWLRLGQVSSLLRAWFPRLQKEGDPSTRSPKGVLGSRRVGFRNALGVCLESLLSSMNHVGPARMP